MPIQEKNKVTLDYEGRLETGEVFDSSKHGDHSHPLTFTVGDKEVIPGFENAVVGMEIDEEKEFTILPEDGYGMPDERLLHEVPKQALPPEPSPEVGMTLVMETPQGQIPARISQVKEDSVVLDLNHPLAGKTLTFKIKILKVE